MKNSKRYAPPEGYYETTSKRSPSLFLKDAVQQMDTTGKQALDFGCGSGSETKFLLEHGFSVAAVDGNPDSENHIVNLPHNERVSFLQSEFESFVFKKYDLINSSRSLPFVHKNDFAKVMNRLKLALKPSGIFVGDLYGVKDEWNKDGETMTFVDKQTVERLFSDMEIVKLVEKEFDGKIANGKPKHWHTFSFIVKQPAKITTSEAPTASAL